MICQEQPAPSVDFDVVIIGAGPAGLMAAVWLAQLNIKTLVIEKKSCRTLTGHADGLESRTLEILDSFGLADVIWKESNRTMEVCLWHRDSQGVLCRDSVSPNCNPGLSRFQEVTLGQGRIEERLLEFVNKSPNVQIKWGTSPQELLIHQDLVDLHREYAVELRLGTDSFVRTRYLIGCDGAHSWVRKQLGLSLKGKTASNGDWGVLDCIPTTDFPDIRKRCIIKSPAGNVMIIPREDNLVRFYVQLPARCATQFRRDYQPSVLLSSLSDALKPYYLVTSHVAWCTIYTVGQRLCRDFSVQDRIFLSGDAVHTHSPKAGQGMNVSMQDTYNLGWKLASVLKSVATPAILRTYEEERLPVAERLIRFDRRMCLGVCSGPDHDSAEQEKPADFKDKATGLEATLSEENTTASGLSVTYPPNLLVTGTRNSRSPLDKNGVLYCSKPHLADNIVVGRRLPDVLVLCQSDSQPWHLQERLPSTGQWHLLVFGGDISQALQLQRVEALARQLTRPNSILAPRCKSGATTAVGSVAVYLIHSASRFDVQLMSLPPIFRPYDDRRGREYRRVFADNEGFAPGCGMAYSLYGIAPEGCVVLLRPDQHCSLVVSLEDSDILERFFSLFVPV
ncbi:putative FAD monooxygenase [Aspergillus aculeatinus CBS 121060]|uniref:FAD binding domain protein n=1 Tax=Aspergillus aculeatinus CBS 121060 TaxID=1448322 RepID=A0ACD1HPX1_9EURO|nr:FAD binding domain protein [Aspergillus aculeatinus CBS 121060]RAH75499.1 FAD binding domain protein [Aspergillus aculeatinus CBS 121060]